MQAAHHALIDPLIEPEPSDDTGLNSHFRSTFAPRQDRPITPPGSAGLPKDDSSVKVKEHRTGNSVGSHPLILPQHTGTTSLGSYPFVQSQHTGNSAETNPYRRARASSEAKAPSATISQIGQTTPGSSRYEYPSPPQSASPRKQHFSNHRAAAFGSMNESRPRRSSQPSSSRPQQHVSGRSRGGSLNHGEASPLDTIRKETKTAHRAHHLRKKNLQGADIIDRLDKSGVSRYHHEGPYDAASMARNKDKKYSPVAAVQESNEEALRATPRENIRDAVEKHRPLEGVATVPPGMTDRFGRVYIYEEGTDMQRDPLNKGDYKRVPGVQYHPDDLKGKGEPSYSIEKRLKDQKRLGDSGTEMTSRPHSKSVGHLDAPGATPAENPFEHDASASGIGRSNSGLGSALKKRFGSMRRKKPDADA
ncbi:uncharacterized protein M421DRAFT_416844 [Didymella exigua CBS 183.55]|uniref:Pal1-domain-containing protein n=1 Tax=Didymella exigua CBS 183.55 TaxID=1150837 RepID=A0A6A5RYL5_9PLEO|nr:uncharacterized protein M421DRAFT_416844 [Didymella exigua CBS 183.55]KAF1932118.1 hypothetical protein M421DRAFT_416844 [Didymella exigua CBS 183.55]